MEHNETKQPQKLLTPVEAASYLGVCKSTLAKRRITHSNPAYIKLGKSVRYRLSDLDLWVESRVFISTSDAANSNNRQSKK